MERGIARGAGAMGTKGTAPAESGCSSGLGAGMASPAAGAGAASELTGAPHFSQKRASSEISAPQLLHFTAALLPPRASCSPSYLKPHGGRSPASAGYSPNQTKSPIFINSCSPELPKAQGGGREAQAPRPSWPYIYVRATLLARQNLDRREGRRDLVANLVLDGVVNARDGAAKVDAAVGRLRLGPHEGHVGRNVARRPEEAKEGACARSRHQRSCAR